MASFLFTPPFFLLLAGLLIMTWQREQAGRNPLALLLGFFLVLGGMGVRLLSGGGLGGVFFGLFMDGGLALLATGLILSLRRREAQPFINLGLLSFLGALLVYVLGRVLAPAPAPQHADGASFLLELGPDDRLEEVQATLDRFDARAVRAFPTVSMDEDEDLAQYFLVYTADDAAAQSLMDVLQADAENVDHVEGNRTVTLGPVEALPIVAGTTRTPALADDPMLSAQWGFEMIGGHDVHRLLRDRTPVRKAVVAILDTGVDDRHEDLHSAFRASPGRSDQHGHGSHCAGIAGAVANNGVGVTSLNWEGRFVEVASYKALPHNGMGTLEDIAQAIIDAAEDGVDVISMSLGDYADAPSRVVTEAVAYALRTGAIVVASAGNNSQDAVNHLPSNVEGVIAVAAVDQQGRRARFSNSVTSLSRPIAAPGVDILSLGPGNAYVSLSGTSMATPMVAGLLGVMRALNPALTAEAAYGLLHDTGRTVDDTDQVGRVIDADAALRALPAPGL